MRCVRDGSGDKPRTVNGGLVGSEIAFLFYFIFNMTDKG